METLSDNPRETDQQIDSLESRSERFVDTNQEQLLKSGNLNDLNSFYQGELVHERMAAVRKSIYYIRENWSKFDQFMAGLKSFMENEAACTGGLAEQVKKIFECKRNWIDLAKSDEKFESLEEEFNIIYTYTTKAGFKDIFKVSDGIFRRDSSVQYEDIVRNAVFLVELINIDLYNFVYKNPKYQGFEGIVYRGMAIPKDAFNTFGLLLKQPINKRYISIPLGLWSSSLKKRQAVSFVESQLKVYPSNVPLLMKIHVLNVDDTYLQFYRKKFQERSVVSTICAVYIADLSAFKNEAEVILRGGFYQALNIYDDRIKNTDFKVLEMVMLNSNRDHLSTSTLLGEKEDGEARTLFGTMVGVTRNRFIVNYCKKNDLLDDLEKYQVLLAEGEEKVKKLMVL